jgi:hypothetical protein
VAPLSLLRRPIVQFSFVPHYGPLGYTRQQLSEKTSVDNGTIVPYCSLMANKSQEIKVRVDPMAKLALQQLAKAK